MDKQIADAWEELRHTLPGREIAEMEIEARKEAHETTKNPYEPGSFEALVFEHERLKIWRQNVTDTETRRRRI